MRPLTHRQGLSLVEISIVLVIIALVIGSVLVGQDMINASKKNQVIKDISEYKTAYDQFKEKYSSMPGDMPDATKYLDGTTDGDGNNIIAKGTEEFLVWQHLALEELIKGEYNGDGAGGAVAGVNVPKGPYNLSVYRMFSGLADPVEPSPISVSFSVGNLDGVLTPIDARDIDKKLDDGDAHTGIVWGLDGTAGGCLASSNYDVLNKQKVCVTVFNVDSKGVNSY